MGLAELQLSSRVVVNVVHAHFLHDAKASLKSRGGHVDRKEIRAANTQGGRHMDILCAKCAAHHGGLAPVLRVKSTLCNEDVALQDEAQTRRRFTSLTSRRSFKVTERKWANEALELSCCSFVPSVSGESPITALMSQPVTVNI